LAVDAATLPANTDSFCTSTSGSASVCRVSVGTVIAPVGVPRVANFARARRPARPGAVGQQREVGRGRAGRDALDQRPLGGRDAGGVVSVLVAGRVAADPALQFLPDRGAEREPGEDALDQRAAAGLQGSSRRSRGLRRRVHQRGQQQQLAQSGGAVRWRPGPPSGLREAAFASSYEA
jgi:hypothetical protein